MPSPRETAEKYSKRKALTSSLRRAKQVAPIAVGMTPAGPIVDAADMASALKAKDAAAIAAAGIGFIPGAGDAAKLAKQGVKSTKKTRNLARAAARNKGNKMQSWLDTPRLESSRKKLTQEQADDFLTPIDPD